MSLSNCALIYGTAVYLIGAVLFLIAGLRNAFGSYETHREYCVQFRLKRSRDDWTVINWSVGTHKRAREALKYTLNDRTYRQYEYRVATRMLTEWEA